MFGKWQIFLFDFDGTLVNSEKLHHLAYLQVAKKYAINFAPSFEEYCRYAHFSDHALKDEVCRLYKNKYDHDLDWPAFYDSKKEAYLDIVTSTEPELMEGAGSLLQILQEKKVVTCVVTHSFRELTRPFCKKIPLLKSIDYWITREDYVSPKPAPDSYKVAMAKVKGESNQKVVGFEDTFRGLKALLEVEADAILVSKLLDKNAVAKEEKILAKPFIHMSSFSEFLGSLNL